MIFGAPAIGGLGDTNLVVNLLLKEMMSKIDLSEITNGEVISNTNPHPTVGSACPEIDPSANDLHRCLREGLEREYAMGLDSDDDFEIDN